MNPRRFLLAVVAVLLIFMIGYMAGASAVGDGPFDRKWPFGNTALSSTGALVLVLLTIVVGVWARSPDEFETKLRALSRNEKKGEIGGVCYGLGQYTVVPVWAWRLVFLALLLVGGGGLITYVLLWIALPDKGKETAL